MHHHKHNMIITSTALHVILFRVALSEYALFKIDVSRLINTAAHHDSLAGDHHS